ncbi:hypothetical protein GT348_03300 [Aristophania vespae]|uniref:SH3 domain-containing protein n=1 Tax=Aristophania vespae TaxID=2697033 RepID=A0A6P1NFX0_9PROT|nr:SH3 domain-containing protein [Aristophania vespae]QHI95420.1 hypothetical protein GT348_03300 [Aristophania vespae]UMM64714.1 hypothetical protein DM15PD_17330 [Aristophania vespae]
MKLLHFHHVKLVSLAILLLMTVMLCCSYETYAVTAHHSSHAKLRSKKITPHKNKKKHRKIRVLKKHSQPVSAGPKAAAITAGTAAVAAGAVAQKPAQAEAQPALPELEKGTETGYPIPRFASLRADRVYMRRGPGERYPIDWVYHRRGLPVKIEREFGVWRLVEDSDGQKGWVHQVTLRGSRTFVVMGPEKALKGELNGAKQKHADPLIVGYLAEQDVSHKDEHDIYLVNSTGTGQKIIAILKPGTVGRLIECPQGTLWCHVSVSNYDGWLDRRLIWGLLPNEFIQPS